MNSLSPVSRTFLVLALVSAAIQSCDSDMPGPDLEVDHLEAHFVPARPFYPVHDTVRVVAVAITATGNRVRLGQANWRSIDPTLATVDQEGLIRVLAPGTATIEGDAFGHTVQLQFVIKGLLHFTAVESSQTWMAVDSPHVVQGILNIGAVDTAVLTVSPGCGCCSGRTRA